jgi:hypothetical protein
VGRRKQLGRDKSSFSNKNKINKIIEKNNFLTIKLRK